MSQKIKLTTRQSGKAVATSITAAGLAWLVQPAISAQGKASTKFDAAVTPGDVNAALDTTQGLTLSGADYEAEKLLKALEAQAAGGKASVDSTELAVDAEPAAGEWSGLRGEQLSADVMEGLQGSGAMAQAEAGNTIVLAQANTAPAAGGTAAPASGSAATGSAGASATTGATATAASAAGASVAAATEFAIAGLGTVSAATVAATVAVVGAAAAGGGGGGGSTTGGADDGDGGRSSDGYISGATVFRDLDGDGLQDDNEPFVTTDGLGFFTGLTGTGGTIISVGGTDISTGELFKGILKAPAGSTMITPLTTLVESLTAGGMSVAAAEAKVAQLLGIDTAAVGSILTADPIALAAAGGANAEAATAMQLAAIQAANLLVTINQTIQASGVAGSAKDAANLMGVALNNVLTSATGSLNLASNTVITSVFTAVATAAASTASTAALAKLDGLSASTATAISSVNTYTKNIDASQGVDALKSAVAAQLTIVSSGGLLEKIRDAGAAAPADLAAKLTQLEASTQDMSTKVADKIDEVQDVTGEGSNEPEPSDTLVLDPSLDTDFYDAVSDVDGTINLNTSLAELADLGIENIIGDAGQDVRVLGGFGTNAREDLGALSFDPELDVTLVVDQAADADANASFVNLDASLADLVGLGIDNLVGANGVGALRIDNGFGTSDISDLQGLSFADDLTVSVAISDAEGTISLNTTLAELSDLGIDHIGGQSGSIVIDGGFGVNNLSALNTDLWFSEELDVTVDLVPSSGGVALLTALTNSVQELADSGIDLITGFEGGQFVTVAGLGTNTLVGLGGDDGFSFSDELDVTLRINDDAAMLDLIQALQPENVWSSSDSVESTELLQSLNDEANGAASEFEKLGIDHIQIGSTTLDFDGDEWSL